MKATAGYPQVAAQEITFQPGSRTHGQPRVKAFHPSVRMVSDHPVDEDGEVWMPVHVWPVYNPQTYYVRVDVDITNYAEHLIFRNKISLNILQVCQIKHKCFYL